MDISDPDKKSDYKKILKDWCDAKQFPEPVYRSYGIGDTTTCIVTVMKEFKFTGSSSGSEEEAKESAAGVALSHMTFGGLPPCIPNAVVAFASPSGKEAYSTYTNVKGLETGGWLPVALYLEAKKMIEEGKEKADFLEFLTRGNCQMSDRSTTDKIKRKAAGTFHHQLTKNLVFKLHNNSP